MNIFNLPGPEFLAFYTVLLAVSAAALWFFIRSRESGPAVKLNNISDPYKIAYLTGGAAAACRLALAVLLHRENIKISEKSKCVATDCGRLTITDPLEKKIYEYYSNERDASAAVSSENIRAADHLYELDLTRAGALPAPEQRSFRNTAFFVTAIVLVGILVIKAIVALSRGRTNVGGLFMFTIATPFLLWFVTHPRLTSRGTQLRKHLQQLFSDLRTRAKTNRSVFEGRESAMLGAVFGAQLLSSLQPKFARIFDRINKTPAATSSNSSSSYCSTPGCGSSSSSCGSSGCGGGGGGCGGCGS
ncbi:MAG: TIGR04222 domain-containing membrane protein [Planctomycetota bacterium]